jgi:hypothetical protein
VKYKPFWFGTLGFCFLFVLPVNRGRHNKYGYG